MNDFPDIHERSATWAVKDPQAHARAVRAMFARISGVYDFMNHLLSAGRDRAWRRRTVRRLDDGALVILDLCAGTGDLALAAMAAGKGRTWIAADFCPRMLQGSAGKRGADRLARAAADALALPLRSGSVDAVVVGFGVRNFADVRQGLAEMVRVLRPGGQVLVLDFFRDDPQARGPARGPCWPVRRLLEAGLPLAGALLGRDRSAYRYLSGSMAEFLTPRELAGLMQAHGLAGVFIERQTLGVAHVVGGRLS